MSEAIDYNALNWVKQELGEVLRQARSSLEQYAENRDDDASLQDCAKNLHQARGPLRMVALKGADQLASEMEEVITDLQQATLAEPEHALEVLMQAFLQLPDYLSLLHPGKTDSPAVLLPVINSLREVRGVPVLGVCAVFLPDLSAPLPPGVFTAQLQASENEIQTMARTARTRFQAGLLEWYRGNQGNNGLQTLLGVLRQMQQQAGRESVARLWWVATAVTEAIISGDIPEATENKQMYGQLDRQIKRLVEVGESVFEDPLTDELMKHLLYRIAITESSLQSLQLIKASYNLDKLLNRSGDSLADDEGLGGCSDELLQTVATTASGDIERIKESLEIFTRGDRSNSDSLLPVAGELHALGNMLDMVGLGQIGNEVAEKAQLIRAMATGDSEVEDPALMALANLLVAVEGAVHNLGDSDSSPENTDADSLVLHEGMQAVAREAVADMVRAKEAIVGYIHTAGDFETLNEVPLLLSRVQGSLQLSGQDRAAIATGQVEQFIAVELLEKHTQMSDSQHELLADAVCSIEYYIEELDEAHDEGDRVLGVAESSLDALGYACPHLTQEQGQEQEQAVYEQDEVPSQPDQCESGMLADTPAEKPADSREVQLITDLQVIDASADEEILEIFIEEADEVLAALGEQLAAWSAGVDAEQPLMDARRGFHTIKGSGRMVGALALAEFACAFEDLLNRVIEGAVEPVAELLDLVSHSVAAMTQLLAQVKGSDAAPQADVNAMAHRAMMLSQPGRQDADPGPEAGAGPEVEVEAELEVEVEVETEAELEVEADVDVPVVCIEQATGEQALKQETEFAGCPVLADDADPEILEIYLEEAAEEIASITENIPQWVKQPDNAELLATLRRSLHTLKGSGRMAGAMRIGEFNHALENLFNKMIDGSVDASDPVFAFMSRVPLALQQLFDQLRDGVEPEIDLAEMVAHANALSRGEIIELPNPDDSAPVESCEEEFDASGDDQPAGEVPGNDAELLDIFTTECNEHLLMIEGFLDSNQAPCEVTEALYRSLHTIAGISGSLNVSSIHKLAAALENYFDSLYQGNHPAGTDALAVLRDSTMEMDRLLQQLPEMDFDRELQQQLCARIEVLPLTAEVEPLTAEAEPADDPFASVDSEILEIFLEEASEIIDAGEDTLHAWSEEPDKQEFMVEYQRQLHTLKGGARMVDITPIGDLSHTLESLLTRVVEGQLEVTPELFVLLHDSHDHLAGMLEHLKSRQLPEDASELKTVIDGMGLEADAGVEAADDVGAVEEPEPETVAEQVIEPGPEPEPKAIAEPEPEPEPELDQAETTQSAEVPETGSEAGTAAGMEDLNVFPDITRLKKMDLPPQKVERRESSRGSNEQVRVRADLLDSMVNYAGEINIYRARMEQQVSDYRYNLGELDQTIGRLREQLRQVEIETETHILFRYERDGDDVDQDFDPLEMDRYSNLQELSRSLIESIGDLRSIQELLEGTTRESETLLLQQSRVSTDLQESLLRSRMIPFEGLGARLRRILRQSARELGKNVDLGLEGADGEMDRTVIDRIIAPLEHMLRNAVAHGIEDPVTRKELGKPKVGSVSIGFDREGSEIVLRIEDDGAGLDIGAIRARAVERGLIDADAEISDNDIMQFVLQTGFSTATEVTQISGRGVGMDVVNGEVKQLGGSLHISSVAGTGTVFTVRLPYTLAVNQALLVKAGEETFCIPLGVIEGVVRISPEELTGCYQSLDRLFEYAGNHYQLKHLGSLLGCAGVEQTMQQDGRAPVLLVSLGEKRVAFQLDSILGSREIVIKPLGAQLSNVDGISGATILGDGRVVLILDVMALSRMQDQLAVPDEAAESRVDERLHVMVVDDSITVRKVTTRLLERNGFRVLTAKDGIDAMGLLQDNVPDMMLLDIEMPRMDGFELATHMRNDTRLKHVPIIMITSRTGDKHRHHADQIGVNDYLGKPYQEGELLEAIQKLIDARKSEVCA